MADNESKLRTAPARGAGVHRTGLTRPGPAGGWPDSSRYLLISGALLALSLVAVHEQWSWRFDQLLFDAHLRFSSRPAAEDIVIVAIDEESLSAIGRWPWSRRVHAAIVEQLSQAGARAIALDLIFAEPDRVDPGADAALAGALARSGRAVLPVLPEERRLGAVLVETLPTPDLTAAAARLGHADVELDRDAVARRVYLAAGLGYPRWPSFGLAVLQVAAPDRWPALAGQDASGDGEPRAHVWRRARELLIPFAGPPGHFPRVSAVDVLDGRFLPEQFTNRLVLIGATVTGLGDSLPTPVSGHRQPMPGVEFHANVIDVLRRGIGIETLGVAGQMAITGTVLLLAVCLYPRLTPRRGLLCALALVAASVGTSTVLLYGSGLWFRPSVLCFALVLSYPLWSWLRIEYALEYLEREIHRLDAERTALAIPERGALAPALDFASQLLDVESWASDEAEPRDPEQHRRGGPMGSRAGATIPATASARILVEDEHGPRWLDPRFAPGVVPDALSLGYLRDALGAFAPVTSRSGPRLAELVQRRIAQVQSATERLRLLRELVDNSISQLGNGVVVADLTGRVLLANRRAAHVLQDSAETSLAGCSLLELLAGIPVDSGPGWAQALRAALVERTDLELSARARAGEDLLVHIGPLTSSSGRLEGLVLAFADISALRDSERARAEILAFLSHDLRAPLISVLSLVELARRGHDDAKLRESLARVGEYAARALGLADQFLELTRAGDAATLHRAIVNLEEVAAEALDDVWDHANARGVRIENQLDVEEAWIEADASLVRRAIVNMLANAIEYGPPGSTVRLALERVHTDFRVSVTDEGEGVPAAELPHLFDRFQRGARERAARSRGSGLGLAIVKTVAERHGGNATAESEPGRGSRFCITLPACRDVHRDDAEEEGQPAG